MCWQVTTSLQKPIYKLFLKIFLIHHQAALLWRSQHPSPRMSSIFNYTFQIEEPIFEEILGKYFIIHLTRNTMHSICIISSYIRCHVEIWGRVRFVSHPRQVDNLLSHLRAGGELRLRSSLQHHHRVSGRVQSSEFQFCYCSVQWRWNPNPVSAIKCKILINKSIPRLIIVCAVLRFRHQSTIVWK